MTDVGWSYVKASMVGWGYGKTPPVETEPRPTPAEVITATTGRAGEYILAALADEGYEVIDFKEASIAVGILIDQRNRAVRALADLRRDAEWLAVLDFMPERTRWGITADHMLDEPWTQAVLNDD